MKTPKATMTALLLMLMSCFFNPVFASNGYHQTTFENTTPETEWTFVQEINGIQISLSISHVQEERFLSVQLVNTTSEDFALTLSLMKGDEMLFITHDEMKETQLQLKGHETHTIDGTYLIYISEEDQISDFKIALTSTK